MLLLLVYLCWQDTVIYDARFADAFAVTHINQAALETLCKICVAALEPHRGLVLTKDGSWECVPAKLLTFLPTGGSGACANPKLLAAGDAVHAQVGMNSTNVNWLAMGFKSVSEFIFMLLMCYVPGTCATM